jgi:hypothetical protein
VTRPWLLAAVLAVGAGAALAAPADPLDRLHAEGVAQFRAARFSAAYGRFVGLADVGHKPSAHIAIWMCQNGLELFGKDWDCTGEQLGDWAQVAGVPAPVLQPRLYGRTVIGPGRPVAAAPTVRQTPRASAAAHAHTTPAGK